MLPHLELWRAQDVLLKSTVGLATRKTPVWRGTKIAGVHIRAEGTERRAYTENLELCFVVNQGMNCDNFT